MSETGPVPFWPWYQIIYPPATPGNPTHATRYSGLWWDSLFARVVISNDDGDGYVHVRDQNGADHAFVCPVGNALSSPMDAGWCSSGANSDDVGVHLYELANGFVFYQPGQGRFYFLDGPHTRVSGSYTFDAYNLSRIETDRYPEGSTNPALLTILPGDGGSTTSIVTGDGVQLQLISGTYGPTTLQYASGTVIAQYQYGAIPNWDGGLGLTSVYYPETGITKTYSYGTFPATSLAVQVSTTGGSYVNAQGAYTSCSTYDCTGFTSQDITPRGDSTSLVVEDVTWSDGGRQAGYCLPDAGQTGPCMWVNFVDDSTTLTPAGDGTSTVQVTRAFLQEGWELGTQTRQSVDTCTGSVCTAMQNPVTQSTSATRQWDWNLLHRRWQMDSLGNFSGYALDAGSGLPFGVQEYASLFEGATSGTGTGALFTESYHYHYGDAGTVPGNEQLLDTTTQTSVLAGPLSQAVTYRLYDGANRLQGVIRAGNTQVYSSGAWTTQQRYVGTFYNITSACAAPGTTDPLGRTLQVMGPCLVAGPSSTSCDVAGPVPLTEYTYYASNTGNYTANRLQSKVQYPHASSSGTSVSCGSSSLTTQFLSYDARGHVLLEQEPNGTQTSFSYVGDLIQSSTVTVEQGAHVTTSYTYDVDKVMTVTRPDGLYDVTCYRTGTTQGCTGGTLTNQVQWRAKATNSTGSAWTERVVYSYRRERLWREFYYDASSVLRRTVEHDRDPNNNPTWEYAGNSSEPGGGYLETRAYNSEAELMARGLPYNSPPAFCTTSALGDSKACNAFTYDGAHRLQSLIERNALKTSGVDKTTYFSYDAQSNLSQVDMQFSNDEKVTYHHDDFGNVVAIDAPWLNTGAAWGGTAHYEYDAAGNLLRKQTPAMAAGEYLQYSYDSLSRTTELDHYSTSLSGGFEALYQLFYDSDAPASAQPSCSSNVTNTQGHLHLKQDSFGFTWYSYNALGKVTAELRDRSQPDGGMGGCSAPFALAPGTVSCPTTVSDTTPNTLYAYTTDGRLTDVEYPHGRTIHYGYSYDRVSSVSVDLLVGGVCSSKQVVSSVAWEPYAGLRSYVLTSPSSSTTMASVEYLVGQNSLASPGASCATSRPDAYNDVTGRLLGVWVSTGSVVGSGLGNILQKNYRWSADQLQEEDTCVLQNAGRAEYFQPAGGPADAGYDQQLRLLHTSRPSGQFNSNGGPWGRRDYSYDGLGNRLTENADCWSFNESYNASPFYDQLTSKTSVQSSYGCPATSYALGFTYDADGRAAAKNWQNDSTGGPAYSLSFNTAIDQAHGAVGEVYKSITVAGSNVYQYYYDSDGRRRAKVYPTGYEDEFFTSGGEMVEDRGNASVVSGAGYELDEYVWLDDRPVAVVKANLTGTGSTWTKQADLTGTCTRNGVTAPCGVYFPVTDYIRKPVLLLDSSLLVAGVGDYDPFGHVNRVTYMSQPSPVGQSYTASAGKVLGYFTQPLASNMSTQLRARFSAVDSVSATSDYVTLTDWNQNALVAVGTSNTIQLGGPHQGAVVTPWVQVPSDGHVDARFYGTNDAPTGTGAPIYVGATLEGYEYQKYQSTSTPVWLPLRFPGQYYDAETDLVENWNRFYDPSLGRYLEADPAADEPAAVTAAALAGRTLPVYAYANNNATTSTDSEGSYPCGNEECIDVTADPVKETPDTHKNNSGWFWAKTKDVLGAIGNAIGSMVMAGSGFGPNQRQQLSEAFRPYPGIKHHPNYPKNFIPNKGGTLKENPDINVDANLLQKIEKGQWMKVYKNGYVGAEKVSLHYFELQGKGTITDLKVYSGWSTRGTKWW